VAHSGAIFDGGDRLGAAGTTNGHRQPPADDALAVVELGGQAHLAVAVEIDRALEAGTIGEGSAAQCTHDIGPHHPERNLHFRAVVDAGGDRTDGDAVSHQPTAKRQRLAVGQLQPVQRRLIQVTCSAGQANAASVSRR